MDAKAGGVPPQWEKYMKPFLHEDVPKYGIQKNVEQQKPNYELFQNQSRHQKLSQ